MRIKVVYTCMIMIILLLCGCGKQEDKEERYSTDTIKSQESLEQIETVELEDYDSTLEDKDIREQYPEDFLEIYDAYIDLVHDNINEIYVNPLVNPAKIENNYVSYNISFEN